MTRRQREVIELLADGYSNSEIGEQLGISLDGAKWHVGEILIRLGVDSREDAARWWNDVGQRRQRIPIHFAAIALVAPLKVIASMAHFLAPNPGLRTHISVEEPADEPPIVATWEPPASTHLNLTIGGSHASPVAHRSPPATNRLTILMDGPLDDLGRAREPGGRRVDADTHRSHRPIQ